ncbi:hypothetical protein GO613_12665 [Azoarcus communis]|uniref:hypothetical protein n=1 Tax=Parazoarcus communis TaxID=41977 RepID=UPI001459BC4E|nr:hypothetical protein [Parazoarcus communis]NMG48953.1 hypothetical protein [Parazoarcus communis]
MGMPVTDTPIPRYLVAGFVGVTTTSAVEINGGAAAGSRRVLGSADAYTEMVRIDFDTSDDVLAVRITAEQGQGAHGFSLLALVDPGDDHEAANRLNAGTAAVIPAGQSGVIEGAAIRSVYLIARGVVDATAASVKGRAYVEGYAK